MRAAQIGFSIDSWGDLLLLLGAVVLGAVALPLMGFAVARRVDYRTSFAVFGYDFWLDIYGVSRRRRRELRSELRQNLLDASSRVGTRRAVDGLGPVRELAAQAAEATRREGRPRWSQGGVAAALAFGAVALVELLAVLWWMTAADSSGAPTVSGTLALFPGSAVKYSRLGGTAIEVQPGWLVLAAAGATFAVVSRPWLLLNRGRVTTPRAPA